MIRRIFKIIAWIAGSTLGFGVALYLIAVAINWRDREPSAAAIRFTNLYRNRPTVADIEGVRRAALIATTLHASNVDAANVAGALAAASLRDPYTNRPFEWDEKEGAILFRGLELDERGEHRIRY